MSFVAAGVAGTSPVSATIHAGLRIVGKKILLRVGEKTLANLIDLVHFGFFHFCCHPVQR